MALVADQVIVELQAKIDQYEANLARAESKFTKSMNTIDNAGRKASRNIAASFAGIAAGFASAQGIQAAARLIDASTRVTNSLKVTGLAGADLKAVYDQLFASAQRNAAPINDLATLYSRAATNAKELGADQADLAKFTDVVAQSLRAGGGTAEQASGALLQLGQALGSTRIQAEEYNSLIDGARPLLQAVAAGIKEAGGSVATLTQLVKAGKISNKAFFDGAIAGSGILEQQLSGSELTISSSLVRLQNVLIDVAGKFNESTGAGRSFASVINDVGNAIEGLDFEKIGGFIGFINNLNTDLGNIPGVNPAKSLIDGFGQLGPAAESAQSAIEGLGNSFSQILGGHSVDEVAALDQALGDVESSILAVSQEAEGIIPDAANEKLTAILAQLQSGKLAADDAAQAIRDLGTANPEFSGILNKLAGLVDGLNTLRQAAVDAFAATSQVSVKGQTSPITGPIAPDAPQISITDPRYRISGAGAGGGGKKSPAAKFDDSLQKIKDQTTALGLEQAALGQLTFEAEKAKITQDLLNEARDAGIKITPKVTASIDEASDAYARAAQTLESAKNLQEAFTSGATSALTGFISDLREGKSAAEALSNVFDNLANQLIEIAAQNLVKAAFGGLFGGGGGIGGFFSGLFGGKGFASGTANTGGTRGQPTGVVHGQEAVIPLPSGGKVPVVVQNGSGGSGGTVSVQVVPSEYFDVHVRTVSGDVAANVVSNGIAAYDGQLGTRMTEKQLREGR